MSSFLFHSRKSVGFLLPGCVIRLVSFEFTYHSRSGGLFLPFHKFLCSFFWLLIYGCHLEHTGYYYVAHRYFIVHRIEYLWRSKVTVMQNLTKRKLFKFYFFPHWLFSLSNTSIQIISFSFSRNFWQIE